MKVARIYMRVSTEDQDIRRQDAIIDSARVAGYYIAGVYRDIESGVRYDRPSLLRMIEDLQPGDVVIAEQMDRLSRGPLIEAEKLIATLKAKGARLSVPGIVELNELSENADSMTRIFVDHTQEFLLKVLLQLAHDDWLRRRERQRQGISRAKQEGKYKGKRPNRALHARIVALREAGQTIAETARLASCSVAQVKRVWAAHQVEQAQTLL
ncbi:recombinase family protein [Pseudomonas syringae]|uniref:recombinase family protein n=1 Tax=Pseudomonas syringae TaxID=317 RepID=UPI0002098DDD|nr:recombinase family protein [Pseudomonas syringae]MDP5168533.1 recombinase family protein [Pseudomonas syringae pv. aptata str. DSM 50252]